MLEVEKLKRSKTLIFLNELFYKMAEKYPTTILILLTITS